MSSAKVFLESCFHYNNLVRFMANMANITVYIVIIITVIVIIS